MPESSRRNRRKQWGSPKTVQLCLCEESQVTTLETFDLCDLPSLSGFGEDMPALQGQMTSIRPRLGRGKRRAP